MKSAIPRILLALLLSATAAVVNASNEKFITSNDLKTFDTQSQDITAGMAAGGRFQFVSAADHARVTELLGLMHDILVKYPDVNTIGDRDKIVVFNSQEEINGILTNGDSKRLICEKAAPVGTHLSRKVCVTRAQKEQQLEDARRLMQQRPGNTINAGG